MFWFFFYFLVSLFCFDAAAFILNPRTSPLSFAERGSGYPFSLVCGLAPWSFQVGGKVTPYRLQAVRIVFCHILSAPGGSVTGPSGISILA